LFDYRYDGWEMEMPILEERKAEVMGSLPDDDNTLGSKHSVGNREDKN